MGESIEWLQKEASFAAGDKTVTGRVIGIEGTHLDHAKIAMKDGTILDNIPVSMLKRGIADSVNRIVTLEDMSKIPERKYSRNLGNGQVEEVSLSFEDMLTKVLGIGVRSWDATLNAAARKK